MNSLHLAREEWERKTTPHTKLHPVGKNIIHEHEFRQLGQAIAFLKWDEDCIEIAKFETLQPGQGAAKQLLEFLKGLADKYQIQLFGHATVYVPDLPIPKGKLLTQEQLEIFYIKHGFRLRRISPDASEILYP